MEQEFITEAQFFTMVNLIAEKHGGVLGDVDFTKNMVNIDCPPENDYACSVELEDALRDIYVKSEENPTLM